MSGMKLLRFVGLNVEFESRFRHTERELKLIRYAAVFSWNYFCPHVMYRLSSVLICLK
jgi:hypothetical protein